MEEPITKQNEESTVEDKTEEEIPKEKEESRWNSKPLSSDPLFSTDPLFYKVADYFGMDPRSTDINRNKIIEILNWGKEDSPTKDDGDVLLRIKDLEKKLNVLPGMAQSRHAILYRYIVLSRQKSNVEKEMKAWENS